MRYGYCKLYAELDSQGRLQICGGNVPNTKQFGFATRATMLGSQLLGAAARLIATEPQTEQGFGLAGLVEADMYKFGEDQVRVQEQASAVAINEALLAAIADRVRGVSARLVVVPAPTKFEYDSEGGAGNPRYSDALEQKLIASCSRLAIDVVPTVQQLNAQDFCKRPVCPPRQSRDQRVTMSPQLLAAGVCAAIHSRGVSSFGSPPSAIACITAFR